MATALPSLRSLSNPDFPTPYELAYKYALALARQAAS